jgi:hypothetical protein
MARRFTQDERIATQIREKRGALLAIAENTTA